MADLTHLVRDAYPDWGAVEAWLDQHVEPADRPDAWRDAIACWLDRVADVYGGRNNVFDLEHVIIWLQRGDKAGQVMARFIRDAHRRLIELLGPVAGAPGDLPVVVLVFDDRADYQRHMAGIEGPDRDTLIESTGLHVGGRLRRCFISGCARESTAVHELCHACVCSLKLPQWLDEGLAMFVSEGEAHPRGEQVERLRAVWRRRGLDDFWSGFAFTSRESTWTYDLAHLLITLASQDHREGFASFVENARWIDSGDDSARRHLGIDLGALAAKFLGPGDWSPGRSQMELGIFTLYELDDRGDVQQVREILRMLLEAWPSDRDVCNAAAWLLATSQHEAVRDGARALELARIACDASAPGGAELGTMAAALAETGRFDEAFEFQQRAKSIYPSEWLAAGEARLELYRQRRPYRRDPSRGGGW